MKEFRIEHPHNEASALVAIHNRALLESRGWEIAFWVVSDEKRAEEAIAALGRHADGSWSVAPLKATLGELSDGKSAEDCETLARAGAWIYVFGSQYGSKDGPLQAKRHFVARFNESLVESKKKSLRTTLELVRPAFVLHRLINDAFRARRLALIPLGDESRAAFLAAGKKWADRIREDDYPLNVEGSTFLPDGHLLLGLRYPVTAAGHPILVELDGIDRLFEGGEPEVTSLWLIENVGSKSAPAGIRELDQRGTSIHLITGNLDSKPEESALLAGTHAGDRSPSEHHVIEVPPAGKRTVRLDAKLVRRFDDTANVEGIAIHDDGTVWYAHDDEQIRLTRAKL